MDVWAEDWNWEELSVLLDLELRSAGSRTTLSLLPGMHALQLAFLITGDPRHMKSSGLVCPRNFQQRDHGLETQRKIDQ